MWHERRRWHVPIRLALDVDVLFQSVFRYLRWWVVVVPRDLKLV